MAKEMWSEVTQFKNGDNLSAEVLNIPIGQLGARTSYLYSRLKELLASGKMSSVVLTDVELSSVASEEPDVGNIVYFDSDSGVFAKAKATMSLYDDFSAAKSAFSIGILQRKENNRGDVVVYGGMSLSVNGVSLSSLNLIESGETFRPGRYYLSANEAGKLTAHPNGPLIYVCSITGVVSPGGAFESGTALINTQFLDIGTSHVHRTAVLTARPAGTLSTKGYLPLEYSSSNPDRSLSLRFGGTWTADEEVTYEFFFTEQTANWEGGVALYWHEWHGDSGKYVEKRVDIPAPDVEVPVSNGLLVSVSFPNATQEKAYSSLSPEQRRWAPLVFPEAGRGWLDHLPTAVTSLDGDEDSTPKPHVAIRGKFDSFYNEVNVAFPSNIQKLVIGTISAGSTFEYNGVTYEFTSDSESYLGNNTAIDIGPKLADTVMFLAKELDKSGNGRFAVLESEDGDAATLVAMDADAIPSGGIVSDNTTESIPGYNVIGATDIKMVVFDGECRILGSSAVASGIRSYAWNNIGNKLEVMVFQDVAGSTAHIEAGCVLTGIAEDDEPDALYDYSLGFEPKVANYWPPIPVKSAALVVNGVEMDNKALLPDNPTVSFGRKTIHWFENATGRKPWPEAFANRSDHIDPAVDKTEVMHWVRGFQGSTGPVTSIQVRDGSPLKIVGYGTNEVANVGDLEIVGDFDFKMVNGGVPGSIVPKRMRGGRFVCGHVVERVIGGAGIAVIPHAGSPDGQGTVVIALDNGGYHSQFSDIALENAEQAKIGMFPYIRLKGYATTITSPSAFTAMMRVPTNLPNGRYSLKMQASVFGEEGFTGASQKCACVKLMYNILPDYRVGDGLDYRNLKTSLLKPNGERNVIIPFGHESSGGITYNGFDPVLVKTDDHLDDDRNDVVHNVLGESIPCASEFYGQSVIPELRPGNLVGIRLSRAVTPGDYEAYNGPIGFINLSWSLVAIDNAGTAGQVTDIDTISEAIRNLQHEVQGKVSKNAMSGSEVYTNTAAGMRTAVQTMSGILGADVKK